jgi:hypothetical protein
LRKFLDPVLNRFARQTLPTANRNISLWMSFAMSRFANKTCIRERCSSVAYPQARLPFWTLKQASELEHARCYLDCDEAGLYFYLMIQIEILLRPLQMFSSIFDLFTDSPSYILTFRRDLLQHSLHATGSSVSFIFAHAYNRHSPLVQCHTIQFILKMNPDICFFHSVYQAPIFTNLWMDYSSLSEMADMTVDIS